MKTKFLSSGPLLRLGGCLALLAGPASADAQALAADTSTIAAGLAAASQQYSRALGTETILFDGPEYVDNTKPGIVGHPFFGSTEPQLGTIRYRGGYFRGVLLRYDLATDQVVLTYPSQAGTVALVPEKISYFTLGSSRFVRVAAPDSAAAAALPAGFYEVLLDGPVSLLAHHSKRVNQSLVLQTLTFTLVQTDQLFVRTATQAAEVTNLKSMLALFPTHQVDLKRYASEYNLHFGTADRAASATQLLRYAATLLQ